MMIKDGQCSNLEQAKPTCTHIHPPLAYGRFISTAGQRGYLTNTLHLYASICELLAYEVSLFIADLYGYLKKAIHLPPHIR